MGELSGMSERYTRDLPDHFTHWGGWWSDQAPMSTSTQCTSDPRHTDKLGSQKSHTFLIDSNRLVLVHFVLTTIVQHKYRSTSWWALIWCNNRSCFTHLNNKLKPYKSGWCPFFVFPAHGNVTWTFELMSSPALAPICYAARVGAWDLMRNITPVNDLLSHSFQLENVTRDGT